MKCPACGGSVRVTDTRSTKECVARRRQCVKCNHVFFTEEWETPTARDTMCWCHNLRQYKSYNRGKKRNLTTTLGS